MTDNRTLIAEKHFIWDEMDQRIGVEPATAPSDPHRLIGSRIAAQMASLFNRIFMLRPLQNFLS